MGSVIGWDIGGAHIKAARAEHGRIADVVQVPSRLWLGLAELDQAMTTALQRLGEADLHVATMTGELTDGFADRLQGVTEIAAALARRLTPLRLYGGRRGWLPAEAARARAIDIASANWHASAALAARHTPDALFIDMGSTTTDLIPLRDGRAGGMGYTDAERLAGGELVYTGVVRSFVMALAPRAPFAGAWTPLACEHFATSADIYRLLGELPEEADQMPTADGREKSLAASRARLARMVGRDAGEADHAAWRTLAAWFAEAQLRQLADAAMLVISRGMLAAAAPIIGAGVGGLVVARLAERLGRRHIGFAELLDTSAGAWVGHCAPAVALALLASDAGFPFA